VEGRFTGEGGPRVIGPGDGKSVDLGVLGVRFMAWGEETGGDFSLVEHPIAPRGLAAPLHRHANEDEYSFVLEGRMGAQLGDDVVEAGPGDFVFKPRAQWHTFWNAGDEPCRILEIISPAGFERYFEEIAEALAGLESPDPAARGAAIAPIAARYGLEIDPSSIGPLCERLGLRPPG
jgi:mannose-6-phosphate isomerase-like protein (cupin superfamily)